MAKLYIRDNIEHFECYIEWLFLQNFNFEDTILDVIKLDIQNKNEKLLYQIVSKFIEMNLEKFDN